jgi:hypothetical protein
MIEQIIEQSLLSRNKLILRINLLLYLDISRERYF